MPVMSIDEIRQYIENHIGEFHDNKLDKIKKTKLSDIISRKNPYLYKATAKETPAAFINAVLEATISSSEETIFGNWLEALARHINGITYGGEKSGNKGQDLVFVKDGTRYIVSIKSGPNWANSSSLSNLMKRFSEAAKTYNTVSRGETRIPNEFVVGCCYGKCESSEKTKENVTYHVYCGQKFWCFISGIPNLYTDLIEPLGIRANERNEAFMAEYNRLSSKLTKSFYDKYCDSEGLIDWEKIVRDGSGTSTLTDVLGFDALDE